MVARSMMGGPGGLGGGGGYYFFGALVISILLISYSLITFSISPLIKKHGSNTENIYHAVLRLGTKLWWLRAPLTFLHATSGIKPQTL